MTTDYNEIPQDPWDIYPPGITRGIGRISDHLPPEHKGRLITDPVVAFIHYERLTDGGETEIGIIPQVPNRRGGGFKDTFTSDVRAIGVTPAAPGSRMVSLQVHGPVIQQRLILGYFYPDATDHGWHDEAIEAADWMTQAFQTMSQVLSAEEVERALNNDMTQAERDQITRVVEQALSDMPPRGHRPGPRVSHIEAVIVKAGNPEEDKGHDPGPGK